MTGCPGTWPVLPRPAVLGDHDVVVPVAAEQLAEHGFGLSVLIKVGRVERGAAGGDEGVEDHTRGLRASAGVGRAEVRRTERVLRDPQPGLSSEGVVAHDSPRRW